MPLSTSHSALKTTDTLTQHALAPNALLPQLSLIQRDSGDLISKLRLFFGANWADAATSDSLNADEQVQLSELTDNNNDHDDKPISDPGDGSRNGAGGSIDANGERPASTLGVRVWLTAL